MASLHELYKAAGEAVVSINWKRNAILERKKNPIGMIREYHQSYLNVEDWPIGEPIEDQSTNDKIWEPDFEFGEEVYSPSKQNYLCAE